MVSQLLLRRLHNPNLKFASMSCTVEDFLRSLVAIATRVAQMPVEAREDHETVQAVFRTAVKLGSEDRRAFFDAQDALQEEARRLASHGPVEWTTQDLAAALEDPAGLPAKMMSVSRVRASDPTSFRPVVRRLYAMASTAEDAVEVACWLIRTTETASNANDLLYEAILGCTNHLPDLRPRPASDAYLALFATHASRIRQVFRRNPHPLVLLLEVYTRLFVQDKKRLDPVAQSPTPAVLDEIGRLRKQHLETVRLIHHAFRDIGCGICTERSTGSLINAYGHGQSIADVQAIWEEARGEGGTGVVNSDVAVVSSQLSLLRESKSTSNSLSDGLRTLSTWTPAALGELT
jgi:hypothetical protein